MVTHFTSIFYFLPPETRFSNLFFGGGGGGGGGVGKFKRGKLETGVK